MLIVDRGRENETLYLDVSCVICCKSLGPDG